MAYHYGSSQRLGDRARDGGADAFASWCRLRATKGERVTVIDLYQMVAADEGLSPEELDLAQRQLLAERALRFIWPNWEVGPGSGRLPEPIEIKAYDPRWPDLFGNWKDRIAAALGSAARRVDHIGSTAVPGLAAKPVVDIQVSVARLEADTGPAWSDPGCACGPGTTCTATSGHRSY